MRFQEVKNKQIWENFILSQKESVFLQSWAWRNFLEAEGFSPRAYFVTQEGEVLVAALVAQKPLPFDFCYLYSPRGPIFKNGLNTKEKRKALAFLARCLRREAGYRRAIFWRFDPALKKFQFSLRRFRKSGDDIQPPQTLLLDLRPSEKKIMSQMRPNTRNSIRKAFRRGIRVRLAESEQDLAAFWSLLEQTSDHNQFFTHPKEHYQNLWRLIPEENLDLYLAEFEGRTIAAAMIVRYGRSGIYLHAASDHHFRKLMASYALQWRVIQDLKKAGCVYYDLWGVAPRGEKNHPWQGFTRFKKSFGGEYRQYVGTYDRVYRPVWWLIFEMAKNLGGLRHWFLKKIKFKLPAMTDKIISSDHRQRRQYFFKTGNKKY